MGGGGAVRFSIDQSSNDGEKKSVRTSSFKDEFTRREAIRLKSELEKDDSRLRRGTSE